jgi:hypothetical protein
MDLCEQFDLRFCVVADRFVSTLKERYDQMQIGRADLGRLCARAKDAVTKEPISEPEKCLIRRRDLKTIEKYISVHKMDERAFDRTVEEIKYRYYEVARALLKHRRDSNHRYMKYPNFDIEQEISRKNNFEIILARGKEQFEKETALLQEHLKIESQILKVEREDERKLKLIGKQIGV